MIFQEPMVSLNPLHTLEKQLYEVLSIHRGMRKEAARAEILSCLDRVGIRNALKRLDNYPSSAFWRRTPACDDCHGPADAPGTADCR